MLSNDETGTTHVISFWESKEIAERSRVARLKLRDRITSTVSVEVQETEAYEVSFADLSSLRDAARRTEMRDALADPSRTMLGARQYAAFTRAIARRPRPGR